MRNINKETLENLMVMNERENVTFIIGNGRIIATIKNPTADQSTQG